MKRESNILPDIKSRIIYLILFATLIFIHASYAWTQEGSEIKDYNTVFFSANNSYREERYNDAIEDYESLVNSGFRSANLFYNLGNAYLKTGNRGKAILYYERAHRMNPRDVDIRSNLGFTRSIVEGEAGQKSRWYQKFFFFLRDLLSIRGMTFLVSIFYFIIMICLILSIFLNAQRKILYYLAIMFFILFIVSLPSFINGIHEFKYQKKAVIMVQETVVRFEPNDDATVHFKVYEGSLIRIMKLQEEWYQIKRHDGKMGWLKGDVFIYI